MRKFYFFASFALSFGFSASSQTFNLVKDINPGVSNSNPSSFTIVNGTLFFAATTAANGTELWKSDGTSPTTVMVKDINPGAANSSPSNFFNLNGILYFRATNGVNGVELWKSDGTAAGTMMVKDINPGAASSSPLQLTNLNGTLVFNAVTPAEGRELWKSDGTAAGTVLVKNINTGSNNSNPSWFTNLNGVLYFAATDATTGSELWKTDGTAAGTVLVKDIYPGIDTFTGLPNGSEPVGLINVNNILFFRAFETTEGWSLWKSNGTAAGTVLVKPGGGISMPEWFTDVSGILYFISSEDQLWKSNGTPAGTAMIKEIDPTAGLASPEFLTNVNGTLFFAAQDPANNYMLWKSNGTAASTVIVKNVIPENLANVNGVLYFSGDDGIHGKEVWKSNGTAAGTVMVQDIVVPGSSSPDGFVLTGIKLFAAIANTANGRELWMARVPPTLALTGNIPQEIDLNADVMLYPNPVQEGTRLIISVPQKENIAYSIIDQNGRTIQKKRITLNEGSNSIAVETSALPAGVYTIAVNGIITNRQIKFVKQ